MPGGAGTQVRSIEPQLKERIRHMRKILIGCVMLLAVSILSAQDFNLKFTMKTPFAVSGTTLPAGTYTIRLLDDSENTFECSSVSGSPSVLFEADAHEVIPTTTAVSFAKYGDMLILKNISIAGDQGFWVPISLPEKRSKKAGAKATPVSMAAAKQ
jgi:hypothetical protein